jgi:heat shock protein HslJ
MRVRAAAVALLLGAVAGCAQAGSVDPEADMLTSPVSAAAAPTTTSAPLPTVGLALPTVPSPSASTSLLSRLVGPKWLLIAWSQDGKAQGVPPTAAILFTATAIDAFDGCNDIEGDATYSGSQVRFPPLMSSAVACGEDAVGRLDMASETTFVGSVNVALAGTTLTVSGHGIVLTYTRGGPVLAYPPDIGLERDNQPPAFPGLRGQLVGPLWRLDSFTVGGARVATIGSTRGWLQMGPASVTAGDGCNEHESVVSYDGSVLTFSEQAAPQFRCSLPVGYQRVAAAYQTLFKGRVDAQLANGTLTLTGNGVTLAFSKDGDQRSAPAASVSVAPLATVDPSAPLQR